MVNRPTRSIITAYDRNRVIGHQGGMPWHGKLPADLIRFKKLTAGHTVVMGRATYDSIGRPLPHRRNIVISRQTNLDITGCEVVGSLEEAYELGADDDELFIIGGAKIYHLAMPTADRLLVTEIDAEFEGDTFFPEIPDDWVEIARTTRHDIDSLNKYCYTFIEYERNT